MAKHLSKTRAPHRKTKAIRAKLQLTIWKVLSAEELIAKVREERKNAASLLKESMKRKSNEQTLKEKLAKYGDIAPERALELVQAESAAQKAREDAERQERAPR